MLVKVMHDKAIEADIFPLEHVLGLSEEQQQKLKDNNGLRHGCWELTLVAEGTAEADVLVDALGVCEDYVRVKGEGLVLIEAEDLEREEDGQ